ncbi:hypothetical protein Ccrd_026728 [Cynara cardunculus var. scolymus]|uniref:Uncharacterized protein n=1 Tax=Cynara cardunculus var. scolymus TaxID=59895 RepID=A0A118FXR6_CYNCS|nr:hypothetical protein Ccrd_026728 [Cynara cardunculus var. scolymus]
MSGTDTNSSNARRPLKTPGPRACRERSTLDRRYQAEKAGQPLPYVPIASAARAPAPSSAGEASPDLRSANSVRIDFIQECRRP